MIYFFLIYIVFQAGYDHWAEDTVTWKAVYYMFQFGWVGALAIFQMFQGRYVELYAIIALIMISISLTFLTWIKTDVTTFAMMTSGPPAYTLTILASALFILFILSKRLQWVK